ncbi:MAG: rhomboid family intramembrane serine protease [Planctomycetes bacterium]|nr:rhomboid family intramembrane serine protease [Planctomycetota bacterium]
MLDNPSIPPMPPPDAPKAPPAATAVEEESRREAILQPAGLKALGRLCGGAPKVTIDFARKEVRGGRVAIPFSRVRFLDLRAGVFGLSDGRSWICFDLLRYRGPGGPLQRVDGSLSLEFVQVLYDLEQAIFKETSGSAGAAAGALEPFDFRYAVRIDSFSIVLGLLGVGGFLVYEEYLHQELPVSIAGTLYLLGLLALAYGWLLLWRRSSSIRFDGAGIARRRLFRRRFYPWSEVSGLRHQGIELEIEGRGFRIPLHLDILKAAGSPLLLRRGIQPVLTPLGSQFLRWIKKKSPERQELPVWGSSGDRLRSRLWIGALVALNTACFLISGPLDLAAKNSSGEAFRDRLIALGARTEDSFHEPWRFLASLFLHGDAVHLALNMLVLAVIAPWLGRIFGWWRAGLLYLGSGLLGNVFAQATGDYLNSLWTIFLDPAETAARPISIGSSTAIMGIIGSLLGAVYCRPHSLPLVVRARFRWAIPVMVLLTLGMGLLAIKYIDNAGHLGGFLAGLGLAFAIPPRLQSQARD